ncbi:MAG: hypothetical protein JSV09_15840 [Thermoplasmata archaeon]|nr:MAG: hypothetical protein JSV09_15840 [Thermoplasmata archaeon]
MKDGPVVGIFVILVLILLILALLYVYISPPCHFPRTPIAELTIEEDINETIITIKSLNFEVPLEDVYFILISRASNNVSKLNLSSLVYSHSEGTLNNISYHDKDHDNDLSKGDFFILKTDWDGPNNDGDQDGNFTNDGPIMDGDQIILSYWKNGSIICGIQIGA